MKKFLLVSLLFAIAGVANARSVDRYIIDDGMTNAYKNPAAAVDTNGNVHIVAQGQPNDLPASDDIYYFRISKGGTVRNGPLLISTTIHDNGRAHVATLSDGKAIVAWREHSPKVVKAVVVDPTTPAGVGSIVAGPVTIMDSTNGPNHFDMVVDGASVQFIINGNSAVYHAKWSTTLVVETAVHPVTGLTSYWQDVKVTKDATGNLHIVNRASSDGYPYYAMTNSVGVTQIGETILHDDGTGTSTGSYGNHFAIAMKGSDVQILYGDKRNTYDGNCARCYEGTGGTAFLVTLDPTNHTGGVGAAGDIDELRTGADLTVANTWYFQGFKASDGDWHVMNGTGSHGSGDIAHYRVNGTSVSESLATANNQGYHYYRKYVTGAGNMVVWAEGVFVPTLSGTTNRLVAAKTSEFGGGGGGGGGAPAPLMLLVLGLAGMVRARLRR
jgi:hypothetical protein